MRLFFTTLICCYATLNANTTQSSSVRNKTDLNIVHDTENVYLPHEHDLNPRDVEKKKLSIDNESPLTPNHPPKADYYPPHPGRFYFGGSIGLLNRSHKGSGNLGVGVTTDGKYANLGALLRVFGGFGYTFKNNLYLSIELDLNTDTSNEKVGRNENGSAKTSFTRKFAVGLTPRIGYWVQDNLILYTRLGFEVSFDKFETEGFVGAVGLPSEINKNITNINFCPGLGLEHRLTNRLAWRLEYNFTTSLSKKNVYTAAAPFKVSAIAHSINMGFVVKV